MIYISMEGVGGFLSVCLQHVSVRVRSTGNNLDDDDEEKGSRTARLVLLLLLLMSSLLLLLSCGHQWGFTVDPTEAAGCIGTIFSPGAWYRLVGR